MAKNLDLPSALILLRAAAHTHRILGMQAARLSSEEMAPAVLLKTNLAELDDPLDQALLEQTAEQDTLSAAWRLIRF